MVARGDPVRVSICHCLACQKRTGSAFGVQARFPEDAVTVQGRSAQFARTGDEGTTARFHFCPECGATVFWSMDAIPGYLTIPVGVFADPAFPPPFVSVYGLRKHPWVRLPDGLQCMD
ncbi:GFA family protein [Lysobacter arvi]|uniref:GFA family protein n=1 Tax=Lysobacter arvi TaxID=3038776 RepID=A0ABU1CGZ9_9GAMM|nr:GFA family protein [Lysobacter arvi]MDR0184230.1 GFA family protein [Lysobacter arvi]